MTQLLSIPASPEAPVACDMTSAEDTLAERLAEYRELFGLALVGREAAATSITLRLTNGPGVCAWVLDLVGREAACCPFLSYEVHTESDQLVWRIETSRGTEMAIFDEIPAIADGGGSPWQ